MQAELIVSIIFGSLSILLAVMAIFAAVLISKRTDKLIQTEDARAKQLIDEGVTRTQKMIEEMRQSTQETVKEMRQSTHEILERMDERTARIERGNKHQVSVVREEGTEYKPK